MLFFNSDAINSSYSYSHIGFLIKTIWEKSPVKVKVIVSLYFL